jgi:Lon protease-like protein
MFECPSVKDLKRLCLDLPIFPLPRFSLFPYTLTCLHVFEPRYVQLVEQVTDYQGCFAIPRLSPDWELANEPKPVCSVAGVAQVMQIQKLPQNRYNILIAGIGRVKIGNDLLRAPEQLYRTVRAKLLDEPKQSQTFNENYKLFRCLLSQVLLKSSKLSKELSCLFKKDVSHVQQINAVAHLFYRDADQRQDYLECNCMNERVEQLNDVLMTVLSLAPQAEG